MFAGVTRNTANISILHQYCDTNNVLPSLQSQDRDAGSISTLKVIDINAYYLTSMQYIQT